MAEKKKNSMKDWVDSAEDEETRSQPDVTYELGRGRKFVDTGGRGGIYKPEDKGDESRKR